MCTRVTQFNAGNHFPHVLLRLSNIREHCSKPTKGGGGGRFQPLKTFWCYWLYISHINNLVVRCHSMILPKILIMVVSSNVVMLMVLKWRRKRGVTGLRPPPGGPMAPIIWISTRWIGEVSFRSYLKESNRNSQHTTLNIQKLTLLLGNIS